MPFLPVAGHPMKKNSVNATNFIMRRITSRTVIEFVFFSATTLRQMYQLMHWWALLTMEPKRVTLSFAKEESLGERVKLAV